jgi:hypothetical protein
MSQMDGGGGKTGSKKDGAGGGLVCAHCKKEDGLGTMKCCSRCKRVHYCSVECQKLHWKIGGHKKVCGKEGGSGARGDTAGGRDAPLENPCPICRDNEDDAGAFALCFSCGQMYCGKCNVTSGIGTITSCPTCRAVLRLSDQEKVQRLLVLLERPCGRYTPVAQQNLGTCYSHGTGVHPDHAEAVRLYRLAADQGYAKSQYSLGVCYEKGTGVDQDHTEAVRLYRLAANQGLSVAQYNLGVLYEDGKGVDPDPAEAVRLYHLAADQGYISAQINLGAHYQYGVGVNQDGVEAVRWYRLAADHGDAGAQHCLGGCYESGIGVDQDHIEAARLYRLSGRTP